MNKFKTGFFSFFFILCLFASVSFFIGFSNNPGLTNNIPHNSYLRELLKSNKTAEQTIADKRGNEHFRNVEIFSAAPVNQKARSEFAYQCDFLKINRQALSDLLSAEYSNINFIIPAVNKNIELELTAFKPLSDDFKIYSFESGIYKEQQFKQNSLHYNGIIKANGGSVAVISVFEDHIEGIVSDENGNWVLGPVNNGESSPGDYIFYNDFTLYKSNPFICKLEGLEEKSTFSVEANHISGETPQMNMVNNPVKVLFVADYQMWLDAGQNTATLVNYINGFFAVTKTLYQNENIPMEIGSILYYNSPDPMIGYDTYNMRQRFGAQIQNNMSGSHIAHLISTRTDVSGGIAHIRSLCKPYNPADSSGSYAVSVIQTNYLPYPQYSWTVSVVTHEMGHNVGSRHTHACIWPGGPIDTCIITAENSNQYGFPEGCIPLPQSKGCHSPRYGTIMSYCHFCDGLGGGISYALGFGPMPGDTIRLRYSQASCLIGIQNISTEVPKNYSLRQNYPNPFNPVTNIRFDILKTSAVSLTVMDITGKVVEALVNQSLPPGTYNYDWNAEKYASGIYFYKLETDGFAETRKMVLIK